MTTTKSPQEQVPFACELLQLLPTCYTSLAKHFGKLLSLLWILNHFHLQ